MQSPTTSLTNPDHHHHHHNNNRFEALKSAMVVLSTSDPAMFKPVQSGRVIITGVQVLMLRHLIARHSPPATHPPSHLPHPTPLAQPDTKELNCFV